MAQPTAIPARIGTRRKIPRPSTATSKVVISAGIEIIIAVLYGTSSTLPSPALPMAMFTATGDSASPVRNGKIGKIDRFDVYVSNNLPKGAAGTATSWVSGDGSENSVTTTGTVAKRKAIIAGQKTALTFASQVTKMETVRNPNDFGDFIRSLNVFGYKCVKPESLALLIAA